MERYRAEPLAGERQQHTQVGKTHQTMLNPKTVFFESMLTALMMMMMQ